MTKNAEFHAVITTQHRGVFAGYITYPNSKTLTVRGMRNCLYWPRNVGGFEGLAVTGPNSGTKIGPAADATVHDVTCVLRSTPEAEKAWVNAKWKF